MNNAMGVSLHGGPRKYAGDCGPDTKISVYRSLVLCIVAGIYASQQTPPRVFVYMQTPKQHTVTHTHKQTEVASPRLLIEWPHKGQHSHGSRRLHVHVAPHSYADFHRLLEMFLRRFSMHSYTRIYMRMLRRMQQEEDAS